MRRLNRPLDYLLFSLKEEFIGKNEWALKPGMYRIERLTEVSRDGSAAFSCIRYDQPHQPQEKRIIPQDVADDLIASLFFHSLNQSVFREAY